MTAYKKLALTWKTGAILGLLVPLSVFSVFLILNSFEVAFGENFLAGLVLFALVVLQLPPVFLAQILKLPIFSDGAAFMLADLTPLGWIYVLIFWVLIGGFIGLIAGKIKK